MRIDRPMCARFSVGSILLLHFLRSIATPLSTGVMACLERPDPAGICAPKSVFLLLAKSSAEDGLTQLSFCLGSQDWPVKRAEPKKAARPRDRWSTESSLDQAL